jgi:hypothetical protein
MLGFGISNIGDHVSRYGKCERMTLLKQTSPKEVHRHDFPFAMLHLFVKSSHVMKLLKRPEQYHDKAFPDVFLVTACWVEDSLIQGGAEAGKDYTVMDLYTLAQPFVLSRFEKGELSDYR